MSGAFTHRQVAYRLLPGRRGVWRRLERVLEAQRHLYNAALREGCDAWRLAGRSISYIDRAKSLTVCRREDPEMAVVPVQRGTLKRLDEAMKGFFRRVKAGQRHPGFPRFRSRRGFDSIAVVSGVRPVPACPDSIRVSRGQAEACLRLPGFGPLTVRRRGGNPHGRGAPVSAVLKRTAGKWYAIVCFRIPAPVREDDGSVIGVDMNAGQAAASDGRLFHAPDAGPAGGARHLEGRAKRLSRRLARRKRGSGRRERTRARLAKTKRRLAGMRRDWRHHVLRALADAAFTVAVEDLRVRNMTRSARGAAEEPGSRVRAKAGLNRVILATGWAELRAMLACKAGRVVAVDPAYTSRTWAAGAGSGPRAGGHVDAGSRRARAEFQCTAGAGPGPRLPARIGGGSGGHADHTDANAGGNIRRRGLALLHSLPRTRSGGEDRSGLRTPASRENAGKMAA